MTYIIENANIISQQTIKTTSFLINQDRITSVQASFKRLNHMRMNVSPFIMTPTFVVYTQNISEEKSFQETKNYLIDQFIKKGCTTILTTAEMNYESQFDAAIKRKKSSFNTSPIDYIVAVKVPVRMLTPSFIRKCKKEKVPAIFLRIDRPDELLSVPWGWIRDSLFPYNCPIIPVFSVKQEKEQQQSRDVWKKIVANEKIPTLENEISEMRPICKQDLAKMGIYPLKANLLQGGEVSYNLFNIDLEGIPVEEFELYDYHNDKLMITVHRGKVIRAGEEVLFRSGFGEHVTINKPSFYVL